MNRPGRSTALEYRVRDRYAALVVSLSNHERCWVRSSFNRYILSESLPFDRLRVSDESKGSGRAVCRTVSLGCLLVALGFLAGCRRAADPHAGAESARPWFEEIAARAGIDFVHHSGHDRRHYLPEIMGGGAALFDFDNDGFLDLYLVESGNLSDPSAGSGNRLYRNRGNGTFEDVTERSGAGVRGYGMGVAAGDFDNDGYTDLYITNFGHNVLLKNDGHG
jgi:hypothetical protein